MDPGAAHLHREEELLEEAAAGAADMVGQTAARGHPAAAGGLLRAAVLRPSHGFRPGRGCHTALLEINRKWHGTTWFIEGDITDCFGSLDHSILLGILAEKIHDGRFLRLIEGLLRAGYLEDWRYHATLSGCPQGGIAPVLSNIYLDRLDKFIEQDILPAHNRGARRTPYRPYMRLWQQAWRLEQRGKREAGRMLRRQMKTMPSSWLCAYEAGRGVCRACYQGCRPSCLRPVLLRSAGVARPAQVVSWSRRRSRWGWCR